MIGRLNLRCVRSRGTLVVKSERIRTKDGKEEQKKENTPDIADRTDCPMDSETFQEEKQGQIYSV